MIITEVYWKRKIVPGVFVPLADLPSTSAPERWGDEINRITMLLQDALSRFPRRLDPQMGGIFFPGETLFSGSGQDRGAAGQLIPALRAPNDRTRLKIVGRFEELGVNGILVFQPAIPAVAAEMSH